jgi:stage III sporulation protein AD
MQLIGVALLVGCLILLLREHQPMLAMLLGLAAGLLLFYMLFDELQAIIRVMRDIGKRAQVQPAYVETIIKIVGIAFVTEFAAQTLRDAGISGIAAKVELAGKIFILILGIPILQLILDTILKLLEK